MSVQASSYLFYYSLLELNRTTIVRELCERRVTNCNGKCFVRKQIDKNESAERSNTNGPSIEVPVLKFVAPQTFFGLLLPNDELDVIELPALALSSGWQSLPLQPPRG